MSNSGGGSGDGGDGDEGSAAVRRRSSLVKLSDAASCSATMQILGSVGEDGLGLISWWKSSGKDEGYNEDWVVVDYNEDGDDNAGSDSQTVVVESSGNDHVLSSVTATIIVASLAGPIGDRHRRG